MFEQVHFSHRSDVVVLKHVCLLAVSRMKQFDMGKKWLPSLRCSLANSKYMSALEEGERIIEKTW